jgi:hypothetical protein
MSGDNPYEAPEARVDDVSPAADEAARERAAHLRREAGLRAVGVPCLVFGGLTGLLGVLFIATARATEDIGGNAAYGIALGSVFALVGLSALAATWGYFRLRPWVRVLSVPVALATLVVTFLTALPLVG